MKKKTAKDCTKQSRKKPEKTVKPKKKDVSQTERRKWLKALFLRIKRLPWKRLFEWLLCIPWGAVCRGVARLFRRRVLPFACFFLVCAVLAGTLALSVSGAVCHKTDGRIVTAEQLTALGEEFDLVVVLGCRVYADGTMSAMLEDRVSTAVMLKRAGIGKRLLMSGDGTSSVGYDEVGTMKEAAVEAGIDETLIDTDPYGLSTYDSIARLADAYQGRRVVIVTQSFHLPRALYIAEKLGVEAYGVSADLRPYQTQLKSDTREIFARCKDVFYTLKRPKPAQG